MTGSKLYSVLHDSLSRTCEKYRKAFKQARKDFSESPVHALRVSSRRILATARALKPSLPGFPLKKLTREIKKRLRLLSSLRDLHIQLSQVRRLSADAPELQDFLAWLKRREKRRVKKIRKKLADLGSGKIRKRLRALLKATGRLTRGALPVNAPEASQWREASVLFARVAACRDHLDPGSPQTIHEMRVAFKKFRYTVLLLQPLLVGVTPQQAEEMGAFQDEMGKIQDLEVLIESLSRFKPARRVDRKVFAGVIHRLQTDRQSRIQSFVSSADRIFSFWNASFDSARPSAAA